MAETALTEIDEQAILSVMRDLNVNRDEAIAIVGLRRGEIGGDGDLLSLRPLTAAQRRRLGIGRAPEDVLRELGEENG